MRDTIVRFLTLNVQSEIPYIYVAMACVWVVMVVAAGFSLRSQTFRARWKFAWMALILILPLVGMSLYAIFCIFRSDFSVLNQLGFFRKKDLQRYGAGSS